MKLLIIGATGTLGRQIARRAIDQGYDVRCMVRSFRKAAFLKEWGAELVGGDLCRPDTVLPALDGVDAIIDAATARATDSLSIRQVDWDGKVAFIQAVKAANISRYIFLSILDAENYPKVPLMEIKRCTELFLKESGLDYTILRPCGFLQGLIGQYSIPILEGQAVWMMGKTSPIAYMDTQDIARFAVKSLTTPESIGHTFPVVGSRAWGADEIIQLCERLSGKDATIWKIPSGIIQGFRQFLYLFQWGWNTADRLAFLDVVSSGRSLNANMDETYATFNIDPGNIATMEEYMGEYFERITKKLREIDYEKQKAKKKKKKRSPFKSKA
ncbi:MAG: NAD(P)H-binding protein [Cyanothece sp. SIO2G6]|nr:NAD(P)H-binding protein [Cyanothece sp. SIO2G6]